MVRTVPALAEESTRPADGPAPGSSPAHVLIVDDESIIRTLARTILEREGYRVTLAADGAEALARFQQGEGIDLVLLDYLMPGATGLEVYREMARRRPGVRVIFASGFVSEIDHDAVLNGPDVVFLMKPYLPNDLIAAVRQVLAA